ncbi:MAG: hypothetical protein BWK75_03820 [Candidatus Altiarchaeales archaeon A3]|nr:MAG: hypothetical protein BWK75_03820 [Candidatus Altiarchaeales archaeon A3]
MTRILLDTNILIDREDLKKVSEGLQELLKILNETNNKIVIHPLSLEEIKNDKNAERGGIVLSKLKSYPVIESPLNPENDNQFMSIIGKTENTHDLVDNSLLYCVYKDAADFLITEDEKIHKKAVKIGISDRVFRVNDALDYSLDYFRVFLAKKILHPPPIGLTPCHNLDPNDSIFDTLRKEYEGFNDWWRKICKEGRKAWVHYVNGNIGAILILNEENEPIDAIPPLSKKRRLKICTLKVSRMGYKIGELFIKISIQTSMQKNIDEIYLTHFTEENDSLVTLIEDYGFEKIADKKKRESVFVKRLLPEKDKTYLPGEISKKFYPCFYDGREASKFIVPIRPEYHSKLFTDYKERQITLSEFMGEFIVEGNTIKKAYLCHSKTKGLKEGDILLFYRSNDISELTSLGVVEKVYENVTNLNQIVSYVGKRSVYSREEIEEISKKPTKAILFRWHLHFDNPIKYKNLLDYQILKGPPQTIIKISHDNYLKIKKEVKINDRYTFN